MTETSVWPTTAAEQSAYRDWQYEVASGDTPSGFRDWLDRRRETDEEEDRECLFGEYAGRFRDGYDDETVNRLNERLLSVEIACLWDCFDDLGFGGDSEIVMRPLTATTDEWFSLSAELWASLADPDDTGISEDWATVPLWDESAVHQSLTGLPAVSGANYARDDRTASPQHDGSELL